MVKIWTKYCTIPPASLILQKTKKSDLESTILNIKRIQKFYFTEDLSLQIFLFFTKKEIPRSAEC